MKCKRCNQEIDRKKERYVHVEDYNGEFLEGDSWWHLKCFIRAMNRDLTNLEKQAGTMLEQAKKVYTNLFDQDSEPKEVFNLL